MSFMEDFAEGFGTSFGKGVQSGIDAFQAEEKEKLKSSLSAFGKKVTAYNDAKSYDTKAADLVSVNVPDAPEGLVDSVAAALRGGMGTDSIVKSLRAQSWKAIEAAPEAEVAEVPDVEVQTDEAFYNKVENTESSGNQTNAKGETLESDKGALGVMQALPSTARQPGYEKYGVKSIFDIAKEEGMWDDEKDGERTDEAAKFLLSDETLNRKFGRNYLDGMLTKFDGDKERALVAYNYGPGEAEEWDGDRDSLPEETRNYLNKILGPKEEAITPTQQDEDLSPRFKSDIMNAYGISSAQYDMITKGYQARINSTRYVLMDPPDDKDGSTPDWRDLSKIRKENYIAFEAAARHAGDDEWADTIKSVGVSMDKDTGGVPKYKDFASMTDSNAEGRYIAAEIEGDEDAMAQIQGFIYKNAKYNDISTLTMQNAKARLRAARADGNESAAKQIVGFLIDNNNELPAQLSKGYIQAEYAKKRLAAESNPNDSQAQAEFTNFKERTLPILLEAMNATEGGEQPPKSVFDAYMKYEQAKATGDVNVIKAAKDTYHAALRGQYAEALIDQNVEIRPILLIDPETGVWTRHDARMEGTTYVTSDGQPIDTSGMTVKEVDDKILNNASDVLNPFRADIRKFNQQSIAFREGMEIAGDIYNVVLGTEGRVLQTSVGLVKGATATAFDIATGVDLINEMMQGKEGVTLSEYEDQLRSRKFIGADQTLADLAKIDPNSEAGKTLGAKAIFDAKMLLMAFKSGSMEGQSGNAMSNKDFERLKQFLGASKDYRVFLRNLGEYMQTKVTSINQMAEQLNTDPSLQAFQDANGFNPLNQGSVVRGFSRENAGDNVRLQNGWKLISGEGVPQVGVAQPKPAATVTEVTEDPDTQVSDLMAQYEAGETITVTQAMADKFPSLADKVGKKIRKPSSTGNE